MNDSRQDLDGLQRREREHLAVCWTSVAHLPPEETAVGPGAPTVGLWDPVHPLGLGNEWMLDLGEKLVALCFTWCPRTKATIGSFIGPLSRLSAIFCSFSQLDLRLAIILLQGVPEKRTVPKFRWTLTTILDRLEDYGPFWIVLDH